MENTDQTTNPTPDIEAIRQEAYQRGRDDALAEIKAVNVAAEADTAATDPIVLSDYRKGFWE